MKTLYHGTTTKTLDDILTNGLRPRHDNQSNWQEFPSRKDMIYLTDSYAPHFALCAYDVAERKFDPVVIEVNVKLDRLYPDEDYLEQKARIDPEWKASVEKTTIQERTKFFRDELLNYKNFAEDSIKFLGNACYKGVIKPKNIKRYTILDAELIINYSDPTITLENKYYCGDSYKNICSHKIWQKPYSKFTMSTNKKEIAWQEN